MSDPRDFLLNTDYEMDKIVYYTSGELTPTGFREVYVDEYNLGFTPLVFAVLSFSEDFSDSRMDAMFTFEDISVSIYAYSDGVTMYYVNNNNPNQKIYYRIYGFEPSDSTSNVGTTQKDAKTFILNTDYEYSKLYKKGIISQDATIEHNLGYTPFVMAWEELPNTRPSPNVIFPCYSSGNDPRNGANISITDTNVTISNITSPGKVHYRIYYDEV